VVVPPIARRQISLSSNMYNEFGSVCRAQIDPHCFQEHYRDLPCMYMAKLSYHIYCRPSLSSW